MRRRKEIEDDLEQDGLGICEMTPEYQEALRREWADRLERLWPLLRRMLDWYQKEVRS